MKASALFPNDFLIRFGILDWGYTEDPVPHSLSHYEAWANQKLHVPLEYLNDHRKDQRRDVRKVFPEFQSALVFLFSYQETKKWMLENNRHEVAAYSLGFGGEDYHHALKRKLQDISEQLKRINPEIESFITLDVQPILERDLAYRAGLGWFGKNSMLINQKEGSYFIIGSLLLNKKLEIDKRNLDVDHCGHCVACVDACPTNAINPETRTLEASKCISTFTIEIFKEAEPPAGFEKSRGEVFGCDICQDVCPWNKKPLGKISSLLNFDERFIFLKNIIFDSTEKLSALITLESNRSWKKKLFGTAFDRPGRTGWLKNLKAKSRQSDLSKKNRGGE